MSIKLSNGKRQCGAKTRTAGKHCKLPAGHNTNHTGWGCCALHSGSTPAGIAHAAREEMEDQLEAVSPRITDLQDVSPTEALLLCVQMSAGEVAYFTNKVRALSEDDTTQKVRRKDGTEYDTTLHIWIRERQYAIDRLARHAKMAVDAGVAEAHVRLAERMAVVVSNLAASIMEGLKLTPAQKALMPSVIEGTLLSLEADTST